MWKHLVHPPPCPSFPRSAWERTASRRSCVADVIRAMASLPTRGASCDWGMQRLHTSSPRRGSVAKQCVPTQSVGTRGAARPSADSAIVKSPNRDNSDRESSWPLQEMRHRERHECSKLVRNRSKGRQLAAATPFATAMSPALACCVCSSRAVLPYAGRGLLAIERRVEKAVC